MEIVVESSVGNSVLLKTFGKKGNHSGINLIPHTKNVIMVNASNSGISNQ